MFDAHVRVAALAKIDGVQAELDRAVDALAKRWIDEYRVAIKVLADERRAVYDEVIVMARDHSASATTAHRRPQRIDILRPRVRAEETKDGDGNLLPTKPGHLMSAGDGEFPIGALNAWEHGVLEAEMARADFLAWHRNPAVLRMTP